MTAVVDFSKDVMLGMLRKGQTGTQILDILNVLVPEKTELTREQVCEDLGIGATGNQILDILNVIVPDQTELTDEEVSAAD